MARAVANKLYQNFTAGLITEATPLTYPENASVDEDNCVITRRGNRRRRLGVDFVNNYVPTSYTIPEDGAEGYSFEEYEWNSVGNNENVSFLVVQAGAFLRFFDISNGLNYPVELPFQLDLETFILDDAPVATTQARVAMAAGRGYLFVTGPYIEPLYIAYDGIGNSITARKIPILIRDLVGVNDGLSTFEEPGALTDEHKYNLLNQGWVNPVPGTGENFDRYTPFGELRAVTWGADNIAAYQLAAGRYPSNSQVWWASKNETTQDFDAAGLVKQYFGGTRAPRGHFIIDAMLRNRSAVSGISGLTDRPSKTRPADVAFWAGRAWWCHENDVYFSQVMEDVRQAGNCYQEADPTSEQISDLIDSDGGRIPIPEAINIQRLIPYGNGLLVFASNGVWHARGSDSGFTARSYGVDKVSSIGLEGPDTVVVAGQNIFWFSKLGIQAIQQQSGMFGPIAGSFETTNIAEKTIQTFFNESIAASKREFVKGHYDPSSNTVQWLFQDGTISGNVFFNRVLNYDLALGAFYPWTMGQGEDDGPWLCGVYLSQDINDTRRNRLSRYICLVPNGDDAYTLGFAVFNNENFADWQQYDGDTGYAYESRIVTGYELLDDAMRPKQIDHLQTYFKVTETLFVDEGDGDYSVDKPSSCKFRVRWDWADDPESGKWTKEIEAYRHHNVPPVDPENLAFNCGYDVLATKHKVSGNGRAIQFEFRSSKIGHDFDLLGWAASFSGNTQA